MNIVHLLVTKILQTFAELMNPTRSGINQDRTLCSEFIRSHLEKLENIFYRFLPI